jgi:hypothetical protein
MLAPGKSNTSEKACFCRHRSGWLGNARPFGPVGDARNAVNLHGDLGEKQGNRAVALLNPSNLNQ